MANFLQHSLVSDIMKVVKAPMDNIMNRNLNLLKTLPANVFILDKAPPPLGYHRLRPNFSGSFQLADKGVYGLKTGRVEEIFRLDRWKKPWFLVWMLGYPLTSALFAFAAAQWSSLLL